MSTPAYRIAVPLPITYASLILLVLNIIYHGSFIFPRLSTTLTDGSYNNPNLIPPAILDITDSKLEEDLLQSLMDSLGS